MKWVKTFTHDEIEPSEYDGDLKILIQYCFLCQNRKHDVILPRSLFKITIA